MYPGFESAGAYPGPRFGYSVAGSTDGVKGTRRSRSVHSMVAETQPKRQDWEASKSKRKFNRLGCASAVDLLIQPPRSYHTSRFSKHHAHLVPLFKSLGASEKSFSKNLERPHQQIGEILLIPAETMSLGDLEPQKPELPRSVEWYYEVYQVVPHQVNWIGHPRRDYDHCCVYIKIHQPKAANHRLLLPVHHHTHALPCVASPNHPRPSGQVLLPKPHPSSLPQAIKAPVTWKTEDCRG
ncbi:hypothetical protein FB45DRAFT_1003294 [Roridomyces roridus]|uniref:Uncharacterized protein n=1 Tax=Roridomyces roridus TaxID=1738132 RepID=A0AAD7BXG2_9AGAR|nr:hypothetical protein FB45DRAFT_1003294 [Roridomyces roridus]